MAITIRNVDEHEKMLSDLKKQTNTKTMSAALIKGGYDALSYKQKYEEQLKINRELQSDFYDLRSGVNDFMQSFEELKKYQ